MNAKDYINQRIDAIKALNITAAHKLEKLNAIEKVLSNYAKGNLTEEEVLYLIG